MRIAPLSDFQHHVPIGIDLTNRLKLRIAQHYLLQEAYTAAAVRTENGNLHINDGPTLMRCRSGA